MSTSREHVEASVGPAKLVSCKVSSCRRDNEEPLPCEFFNEKTCGNHMHKQCSINFITHIGTDNRPPDDTIICSKRCYNKWAKAKEKASIPAGTKTKISWEDDGSMKALLNGSPLKKIILATVVGKATRELQRLPTKK